MIDQYAVIGNPIAHSKSPWIHAEFARLCDDALDYSTLQVEPDAEAFARAIRHFMEAGAKGANVTMPFKEIAWVTADHLTARAELAGAVNTLTFADNGKIFGDTTDGVGLVNDLANNIKIKLEAKKILILGAGGAVKGVLQPLLEQKPAAIHIVNRTLQRADELVDTFSDYGAISAGSYDTLHELGKFDAVINATPTNFSGELPPLPSNLFTSEGLGYDMSYAAEPTVFERWCAGNGAAAVSNGLGMLVEQAAESFYIWRGRRPTTRKVLFDLKQYLKNQ